MSRWNRSGRKCDTIDASDLGCDCAFTVTDFSIQSSINLQRAGFLLAYSNLMLYREPRPVGE